MEYKYIKQKLEQELDEKRFRHSINVMKEAIKLAQKYGADEEKTKLAGLLHDCAKNYYGSKGIQKAKEIGYEMDSIECKQTRLLHGPIGAYIAKKEYDIVDEDILNAIKYHTTGKENMTLLQKIIYVADYIEQDRKFKNVEMLRIMAFEDIDKCAVACADMTIKYIINKGYLIHPKTINTRNSLLLKIISD